MEKNVNKIAYDISKLDISETDKLIDVLVNKYGIFANIYPYPVGIISLSAEDTLYDVRIVKTGSTKLMLVKTLKEMLGIGLKYAKDIIDATPCAVINDVSFEEADRFKTELEKCGATIEIM